jgi:RND family efflux transporter MFP subunit
MNPHAVPKLEVTKDEPESEGAAFDPARFRPNRKGLRWSAAAAGILLTALLGLGIVPRLVRRSAQAVEARTLAEEPARVTVVRAKRSAEALDLALPGSVQPFQEAAIYARANGYVRDWLVDIGARVKKGQVLADLDVPDIDEELRQARAAANQTRAGIAQAKTQLELARITNRRFGARGAAGGVSQQVVDQYRAAYDAQGSNVEAAEAANGSALANVRRLEDLKGFGVIVAPFDGVVTYRTAEVGELVTAGTGIGRPLFKVAEVDVVRVFVNVPQLYAAEIQVGLDAPTRVRELPGQTFTGQVTRTADELEVGTRTLLTEVDIPNPSGKLIAGMYGQITFHLKGNSQLLLVPATSVLIDALGTRVAVVQGDAISWRTVDVDGDLGDRLVISKGISEGDELVAGPSDRLAEGRLVVAAETPGSPGAVAQNDPESP